MTRTTLARNEVRTRRATLLTGTVAALVCLGAGAASAQTEDPTAPPPEPTQDEAATTEEPATGEATATDGQETEGTTGAEETDGAAAAEEDATQERSARRAPRLLLENVTPGQIYFGGKRPAEFNYKHAGSGTADLRIEVVKKHVGKVVKRWTKENIRPDSKQELRWDGSRKGGGHIRKGRFFFRVETMNGETLARKRADGKREFWVRPAVFPVRGRHQYWDGFGAGRGHQGQDVGARCGTPLVAAEPGKVAYKGYDGGGYGYYVIINVRNAPRSEVYSHLKRSASVRQGSRVNTKEKLGRVGATGNASGCHLHFELHKGDYPGGRAVPKVTKRLRTWDGWS